MEIYIDSLNKEIEFLYEELDSLSIGDDNRRRFLLSRIDKLEGEVNQVLGSWNSEQSKYFDNDEELQY